MRQLVLRVSLRRWGVTQEPPGVAGWEAEWYIRVP